MIMVTPPPTSTATFNNLKVLRSYTGCIVPGIACLPSYSVIAASPVAPKKFRTVLAAEVQDGYILGTILSQKVVRVDHDVPDADVVEVQLTDVRGSFFAGGPDMPPDNFVEVCGALAPIDKNSVVLLRFQRFDKFREILFENPNLAAVRENLENEGFSVDLGSTDLGPAKLLVSQKVRQLLMMQMRPLQQLHRARQAGAKTDHLPDGQTFA